MMYLNSFLKIVFCFCKSLEMLIWLTFYICSVHDQFMNTQESSGIKESLLEGKHEIVDQEVFGVACTCAPWLYTNLLWSSTLVYLFNVNVFKQANSLLLHVLGSWIAGSGPLPFLPFKTTDLRRLGQEAEGKTFLAQRKCSVVLMKMNSARLMLSQHGSCTSMLD